MDAPENAEDAEVRLFALEVEVSRLKGALAHERERGDWAREDLARERDERQRCQRMWDNHWARLDPLEELPF